MKLYYIIVVLICLIVILTGCCSLNSQTTRHIIVRNTLTDSVLYDYTGEFTIDESPRELIIFTSDEKYTVLLNGNISYSITTTYKENK